MFFAGRRVTGKVGESRGRWAARCGSCRPPGHGQGAAGALACWRIPCRPYLGRWQVWWPSPARESWSSRAPCFLTVSFKPENPEAAVKSEARGPWGSVSCGAAGRGGTPQSPVSPRRQHGRAGLECARSPPPSRGVNAPQPPGGPASTQLNAHRCRPLPSTRDPLRPSQQVPPRRAVFSLCLFGVVSSSVCSLPTPGPGCDLGRGVPARRAVTLHSVRPCVALSEQEPGLCGSRTAPVTSARLPKPAPPAPRAPRSPARAGSTPGSRHAGEGLGGRKEVRAGGRGSRGAASQVSGGRRVPLQCCTPCSRRREIQPAWQRHRALQHDALLHPLAEAAGAKPPVGPGPPVPAAGAVAGAHARCAVRGAAPEDPGPRVRGGAAVGADASAAAANAQPQSPAACEGWRGQCSETPPRDSALGAGAAGAGAVLRVRGQDRELVSPGTSGSSRHLRGFQKQV